jgi:hypothetical protein
MIDKLPIQSRYFQFHPLSRFPADTMKFHQLVLFLPSGHNKVLSQIGRESGCAAITEQNKSEFL